MPFNIFESEPEVAQPQPLRNVVDSTTHNTDTFEPSTTTNHPASLKRQLDDYEEPSDPSYDADNDVARVLNENHRDICDSVIETWGINKSGRLFKLPDEEQPGGGFYGLAGAGKEEDEGDHGGSFARALQVTLEEHKAKERVIDLTEKLLEEILSLGSLPVFPDDRYLKFNWISFIAICRRVVTPDKSSPDDDVEQQQQQQQQQQQLLQDLAS